MRSGREREATEIVQVKKAAAVGRLLLGELDGPMEAITVDEYLAKPRRELILERESIRNYLRGEVAKFCRQNFENLQPEGLSELYDEVFARGSFWRVPLMEFVRKFGQFKPGVLKGAPLHSTVHISPWELQTEYPETLLMKDLAVSFNDAVEIHERHLTPFRTMSWRDWKERQTRPEIADLIRRRDASQRVCILSCFNLVEAYINGLAWDFVQTHDVSRLIEEKQDVLKESKKFVSMETKLIKIPTIITNRKTGPLHQTKDPMKTFLEMVKPYRDAIVHASPFSVPAKFGGYDKLSKLYDLTLQVVREAVDVTTALISEIHKFVGGSGELPLWYLKRNSEGIFVFHMG